MLVLTRDVNTSIVIGENVTITLLEVRGKQARFGIEAPREITIHRQEVYDRVQMEKMKSGKEDGNNQK